MRILIDLWVGAILTGVLAEALLIFGFWRYRKSSWVGFYWAAAVAGCLLESLTALITLLVGDQADPATPFTVTVLIRMIGRSAEAAGFWAMAIKALKPEPKKTRKPERREEQAQ